MSRRYRLVYPDRLWFAAGLVLLLVTDVVIIASWVRS